MGKSYLIATHPKIIKEGLGADEEGARVTKLCSVECGVQFSLTPGMAIINLQLGMAICPIRSHYLNWAR